jgi:hypothetical protein
MMVRLSALRAGRPLPPGIFLVLISLKGWVNPRAILRLEELGKLKKSTSSEFDPVTFRLVAYGSTNYATAYSHRAEMRGRKCSIVKICSLCTQSNKKLMCQGAKNVLENCVHFGTDCTFPDIHLMKTYWHLGRFGTYNVTKECTELRVEWQRNERIFPQFRS